MSSIDYKSIKITKNVIKITTLLLMIFSQLFFLHLMVGFPEHENLAQTKDSAIPQTQEELVGLLRELNLEPTSEGALKEEKLTQKIPFTGFLENIGQQMEEEIDYYYSSKYDSISFDTSKILFTKIIPENNNERYFLEITFNNANLIQPTGKKGMTHSTNYFIGNSEYSGITSWEEVWFYDLYPKIDLKYYCSPNGLKYEFVVHPGGDPDDIEISVNGDIGLSLSSDTVKISSISEPVITLLADSNLEVFQLDGKLIPAKFISKGETGYGFKIDQFEIDRTLIIDPIWLGFSTYLGGDYIDQGRAIDIDEEGNVYVTGNTYAYDFPLMNPYQTYPNTSCMFVTKLNSTGNGLIFSTYFGGVDGSGTPYGIAVDKSGNVIIAGHGGGSNFPLFNHYQDYQGGLDAFITKFNTTGNGLIFSTLLGGFGDENCYSLAIDKMGSIYVSGHTESSDFPLLNPYQAYQRLDDVFVTKFTANGSLSYSTCLSADGYDRGYGLAVDENGSAYVTGSASDGFPKVNALPNDNTSGMFITKLNKTGNGIEYSSIIWGGASTGIDVDKFGNAFIAGYTTWSDFPLVNPYQTDQPGQDAIVLKFNATGNGLLFSTYLGGNGTDRADGIAVDGFGNVFVVGITYSADFPVNGSYQTYQGGEDIFVTQFETTGASLVYSTYVGGEANEQSPAVAVNFHGNCVVTGSTVSDFFPLVNHFQAERNGAEAFVFKIPAYKYSTFYGGDGLDEGNEITRDSEGNIYVIGTSTSTDFPLKNSYQTDQIGFDVVVFKLNSTGTGLLFSTYLGGNDDDNGYGIAVDDLGNVYITGLTSSSDFPTKNAYQTNQSGDSCFVTKINSTGNGLVFSTYLRGDGLDHGIRIAVDETYHIYIVGETQSTDFPTVNSLQTDQPGRDVFITKMHPTGSSLEFSTYFGGDGDDWVKGLAIDDLGNTYFTGYSYSTNLLLKNEYQTDQPSLDVFVAKLNSTGNGLEYSTYLGGGASDYGRDLVIDDAGFCYITGYTGSLDFPTKNPYQTDNGGYDTFITKLAENGSSLIYSTYLGGNSHDWAQSIAIDEAGNAYVVGDTSSDDFPLIYSYNQRKYQADGFVSIINETGNQLVFSTYISGTYGDYLKSIVVDNDEIMHITGYTSSPDFPVSNAYQPNFAGGAYDSVVIKLSCPVDEEKPSISLLSPVNNSLCISGTIIRLELSDKISGGNQIWYNWDQEPSYRVFYPYEIPLTVGDGGHVLHVYGQDKANNWDSAQFYFTEDGSPPEVTLLTHTNNSYIQSGAQIQINVTTDIGSINQVSYSWDSDANTTITGPITEYLINETFPSSEGIHVLHVFAVDQLGNWIHNEYVFHNDQTGPTITLLDPMDGSTHNSGTLIHINITDGANLTWVYYEWDLFSDVLIFLSNSSYLLEEPLLINDRIHNLYIVAEDGMGNSRDAWYFFTTDDTGPGTTLTTGINNSIVHSGIPITVEITDVFSTIDQIHYNWDGLTNTTLSLGTSNFSLDVFPPSGDGLHNLTFYMVDAIGNWNITLYQFTIDDTVPMISLNSPTNDTIQTSGVAVQVEITSTVSQINQLTYNWDSLTNTTILVNDFNFILGISTPSTDGMHVLNVYAENALGYWNYSRYVFTTDDTGPSITLLDLNNFDALRSGTPINVAVIDVTGITQIIYHWDSNLNTTIAVGEISYQLSGTLQGPDGQHVLYVYSQDYLNNWYSAVFTFTTDDESPLVDSPNDIEYNEGSNENKIVWTGIDDFPGQYIVRRDGLEVDNGNWTSGFPIIVDIDGLAIGEYHFTIVISDAAGNSAVDSVILTVVEAPTTTESSTTTTTTTTISTTTTTVTTGGNASFGFNPLFIILMFTITHMIKKRKARGKIKEN